MSKAHTAANYAAWSLRAEDFPAHGTPREKLRFCARFGVLAPSVHNTQPWSIAVSDTTIRIAPNQMYVLPVADPDGSFMRMSIGMCAENTAIAARWFGFAVASSVGADGSVSLDCSHGATPSTDISPADIVARLSDKRPYLDREASAALLRDIAGKVDTADVCFQVVTSARGKRAVVDAHHRATHLTASNPAFVRELGQLLRANTTREARGMPGFVADVPALPSLFVPQLLQVYPPLLRTLVAKEAERVVARSAGFGMIVSDTHSTSSDVGIGRVYQRTALLLRRAGLVDAMITAAVTHEDIRTGLQQVLGLDREIRLLFRFGYARPGERRHTPREPLSP